MNIVAFILALFLIFAISTNTLLKNNQNSKIIEKSFKGYMIASRQANNEEEDKYFKHIKNINDKPEIGNTNNLNKKTPQIRKINYEKAKLNIEPLFNDKENNKELYDIFVKLIRVLYSNQSFYKKNLEYYLVDKMLDSYENSLKKSKDVNLINLQLKDDFQLIYYKILKGTKFYDFEKNIGTASLLDFIKFDKNGKKIPIIDASQEILISIFNEKIAKEIEVLQKEYPPKNLTNENLVALCKKYNFELNEKTLLLFDFSHNPRANDKTIVGIDELTQIKIKKNIK